MVGNYHVYASAGKGNNKIPAKQKRFTRGKERSKVRAHRLPMPRIRRYPFWLLIDSSRLFAFSAKIQPQIVGHRQQTLGLISRIPASDSISCDVRVPSEGAIAILGFDLILFESAFSFSLVWMEFQFWREAMRQFAVFLAALYVGHLPVQAQQGVVFDSAPAGGCVAPACDLPRNFDSVYPRKDLQMDMLAAKYAPDYLVQPWFTTPFRNYSYYRPWYTYGSFYGTRGYPYHYAPSWGYVRPWYGPGYLNPGAMAPPAGEPLYHW